MRPTRLFPLAMPPVKPMTRVMVGRSMPCVMRARSATFITSAATPTAFPEESAPEIAFAGRSNVGKSSLINTLVGQKALAKTSSTPGRTRLLNWFDVTPQSGPRLHFVDLPGYGYAKISKEMRASFGPLIEGYVRERAALAAVVVLTKADKLAKNQRFPAAAATRKRLRLGRDPILFSTVTGDGIPELWRA